jgi:hypothetical protein
MTEPTNSGANTTADKTALVVPLVTFTLDDVENLLDLWRLRTVSARIEHVETEGSRRTWTLWENGTQTGHVRGRNRAAESWERTARELDASGAPEMLVQQDEDIAARCMDPTDEKWASPWTWEAAGSGRAALGLPALPVAEGEAESAVSGAGESAEVSFEATDPTGDTVRVTATITSTDSKWEITHVDTGIALAGPPTTTTDAPTTEESGDKP